VRVCACVCEREREREREREGGNQIAEQRQGARGCQAKKTVRTTKPMSGRASVVPVCARCPPRGAADASIGQRRGIGKGSLVHSVRQAPPEIGGAKYLAH